jgi:hypothetical protein
VTQTEFVVPQGCGAFVSVAVQLERFYKPGTWRSTYLAAAAIKPKPAAGV